MTKWLIHIHCLSQYRSQNWRALAVCIMFTGSHQDILFPPNISAKCCGAQPSPGAGSNGTIKTVSLGRPWLGCRVGYGCKYIPAQLSASKADHGHVIENCSVDPAYNLVRCNVLTGTYHEMLHTICAGCSA